MFWNTKKFAQQRLSLRMLKHAAPVLNPLVQEQVKQRILAAIQNQPAAAPARIAFSSLRFRFAKLTAASAFGLLAIFGTAYASTGANPGDVLYPVKRASESVRLTLAPSEETKADLQASFAQERINEFKNLTKTAASGKTPKASLNPNAAVQNAAKKEVKKALHNLQATETNLKKQGKLNASESIHGKINSIKLEAKAQNLIDDADQD